MIHSYIITMFKNKKSVEAAKKCAASARKFGFHPSFFEAITPEDDPVKIFREEGLPTINFTDNMYARIKPAMCCFLSHRELWKKCRESNERLLILEHDAVFKKEIPSDINLHKFVNLGKPSYGQYRIPKHEGIYSLFSKGNGYMPGTHAYMISPAAAHELLIHSELNPCHADLFMNNQTFPFIKEYFPWPIEADDKFTTIQKAHGCIAKHNYDSVYEIL